MVKIYFVTQTLFRQDQKKFMEFIMQKSLMAFLFGLCLLASQTYADKLKIGSWGGNVRSGPSTDYPKIGSLKNEPDRVYRRR